MKITVHRPEKFQCAICKGVFKYDWSEEKALAEAKANGFNVFECATVCDECYEKTPWGTNAKNPEDTAEI